MSGNVSNAAKVADLPVGRRTSLGAYLRPCLIILVLVVIFAVLPAVGTDYWFNAILIPLAVLSLAALGLNVLTGYSGQASLGSGAIMSVGAFATYNFLLRLPYLPLPVSLMLGGLTAAVVGLAFGLPSLRIRGFYLLASTLGAQFFVEWLFNGCAWFSNNSSSGSISAPNLIVAGVDLSSPVRRYLLTVVVVTLLTWLIFNLVRSQTGRNWMAVRDMNTAASVLGVPVLRTKMNAFFVSSFILGIAGALWAFVYLGTADAHAFDLDLSFQLLFMIIIGGLGSIFGSFVGAAFILLFPLLLDRLATLALSGTVDTGLLENIHNIIFGVLIILLLILEPRGLAAYAGKLQRRLLQRLDSRPERVE
jgi:branched-chain amino acid transport system permease protein